MTPYRLLIKKKQNIFTNTLDKKAKNMEVKGTLNKFGDFQGEAQEEYVEEKEEKMEVEEPKEKTDKTDKKC